MLGNALSGWHLAVILLLVLLLFGSSKLPALAQGLGASLRIFRQETRSAEPDPAEAAETLAEQRGSEGDEDPRLRSTDPS